VVKALDRKLLRELWRIKVQAAAIALLCGCAVAVLSGSVSTYRSLQRSLSVYYDRYRFAEVFAAARRAPESVGERIAAVPGVAEVETRVVADASLEVLGFAEPVTAQIVSVPAGVQPLLNHIHLRSGRLVAAPGETLVSEGFAKAHRLLPGDALDAVIGGRRQRLTVVGVALSPEFIYAIRPGDIMPDDQHFGVLWMSRDALAAALDLRGACNSLSLRLSPGASEREVLAEVDRVLAPHGGLRAFGREQHVSHRFISDEIRQLKAIAAVVPTIFLGVAAFVLGVVLTRLIATQRQLIGTFKALGYGDAAVGLHFAKLVALIVLVGAAIGAAGGWWLGVRMTTMYAVFYNFPVLAYRLEPGVVALSAALSLAVGLGGVASAVRRAVRLRPAEAMRPEPPTTYRATLLERIGFHRLLSQPGRMILRNLGRRPWRAALSCLGIAAAVALLVTGRFIEDAMTHITDVQFGRAQREDAIVSFTQALAPRALQDLVAIPGVRDGEPFRAVPAVLRAGHLSHRTAVMGLARAPRLHRLVDQHGRLLEVPPDGVIISQKLAEILHVEIGATLRVEVLEGRQPVRDVRVAALADDLLGVSATMSLPALDHLVGDGDLVSGAFLSVDPRAEHEVFARLKALPRVAGVTLTSAMVKSFRDTTAEYLLFFSGILVFFAVVIAAGVVYNAARIALAERERELATLRILGLTRGETWLILAGELAVLVLLAIPLGCLMGYGFAAFTAVGMDSDLYRLPLVVDRSSYGFAAVVVTLATAAVALELRRRLAHLDLVGALKTKE
jgi:putative ABC transport system permease protein